jgi:hypothetical protein
MNRLNVANFSLWTLLNIDASKFPFSDMHIFEYINKNFLI